MPAKVARRSRHDAPRWSEEFPDTPAGMDRLESHKAARAIHPDTDPDQIDDDDVRQAFLEQRMAELDNAEEVSTSGAHLGSREASPASGQDGAPGTAPDDRARRRGLPSAVTGGLASVNLGVDDAAGLLLGLIAYANIAAALRDPVSPMNGIRSWWAAKFFNKTTATAATGLGAQAAQTAGLALLLAPVDARAPVVAPAPAGIVTTHPTTVGDVLHFGLPATPAPKPPAKP